MAGIQFEDMLSALDEIEERIEKGDLKPCDAPTYTTEKLAETFSPDQASCPAA
jgi:hypothetical protein